MKRLLAPAIAVLLALPGLPGVAAAQTGGVTVTVNCLASPQTLRITNNTSEPMTIDAVNGIRAQEIGQPPFQPGDQVQPGDFVIYAFGIDPGASAGLEFLSQQPLFTTSVAHPETDGAVVQTSVGQTQVTCLQGSVTFDNPPLVGGSRVEIQVDCLASPQSVQLTNLTSSAVTVERLTSQSFAQRALAPFFPGQSIPSGGDIQYAFGFNPGAHAGDIFLSQQPIFSTAPDAQNEDGVLVLTSIGSATVNCATGSGAIYATGTPTFGSVTTDG